MTRLLGRMVLAGGISIVASTSLLAQQVEIDERLEFYGIRGRTPEQLVKQMRANRPPLRSAEQDYFVRAEQHFTWNLSFNHDDEVCEVASYTVNVDMLYILPKWLDQERGREWLVQYWKQFEENLLTHVQGHGDVALEIGSEIAEAISAIGYAETCTSVSELAEKNIKAVLNAASDNQRSYDRRTQHGKTQGAFFDIAVAKGRRRR